MSERIGIIGAMQVEIDLLIERLRDRRETNVGDLRFFEGTLAGRDVVVVRCGVGKVNAAMCTQALIDRFSPACVINTGVAGALEDDLAVGDLVVSTDLVQHDMDVTGLGYEPGYIPELGTDATFAGIGSFDTDERLRSALCEAASDVEPGITVQLGRIASGDQFVCTQELRDHVIATFGASCVEMEGAAIAQVCWRNGVPFVVARTISDTADASSSVEYRMHEQEMAERCAAIVARMIELVEG